MVNRKALKEKYGDEKVFVIPVQKVQNIPDKFTYCKHDDKIWRKYDNQGLYINRWEAEGEPSFQQIIPYFFIMNEDEYIPHMQLFNTEQDIENIIKRGIMHDILLR